MLASPAAHRNSLSARWSSSYLLSLFLARHQVGSVLFVNCANHSQFYSSSVSGGAFVSTLMTTCGESLMFSCLSVKASITLPAKSRRAEPYLCSLYLNASALQACLGSPNSIEGIRQTTTFLHFFFEVTSLG